MEKQFAKGFERTEKGWVIFPSDTSYRKGLFPEEVNRHPAKANAHLVESIIKYVSEPEQTIMDIMAGSGTIMLGALLGRRVICIDISKEYCDTLLFPALNFLERYHNGIADFITIINQPCQRVLPLPVDHIIFSPPYANIMKSKGKDKFSQDHMKGEKMAEYHQGQLNVGIYNEFMFAQIMEPVYRKCFDSLPSGGTLSIIIKDHVSKGLRVPLTQPAVDSCLQLGFKLKDWFKWDAPGSAYLAVHRSHGIDVVEDEDIVIVERP